MKYVTKPFEIEAIQFDGDMSALVSFTKVKDIAASFRNGKWECIIDNKITRLLVMQSDYIIKEGDQLSVMKEDMFNRTYELKA